MKVFQVLQKCLNDWKNISHLDFCLVDSDDKICVTTCSRQLPSSKKLEDFRESDALCLSNTSCSLYKIMDNQQLAYILILWGTDPSASTIG